MGESPSRPIDPAKYVLVLGCYFILHILFRTLVSDSLELDEAEQMVLSQDFLWGYGSKPPLYTWVQRGVMELFGTTVFSLSLLKNALLFSTYVFTYLAAKEFTGDSNRALLASASLFFIPQIAWESQRDLTHSVLVTTCAAATLYCFARLRRRGALSDYLLFGLTAGLGILSKFNFVLFLLALFGSGLSLPSVRCALLDRKMLLALGACAFVTGGYLQWLLGHHQAAVADMDKFRIDQKTGILIDWAGGIFNLGKAAILFVAPALAALVLFFRIRRAHFRAASEPARLIARALLLTFCYCILMILLAQVTHFKDRWMQPLLFYSPLLLILFMQPPALRRIRGFLGTAGFVAAVILLLLPGRTLLASARDDFEELNFPFKALSAEIRKAGFEQGAIFAESSVVGGNLKLHFPESAVFVPGLPSPPLAPKRPVLLSWNATRHAAPPAELLAAAARFGISIADGVIPRQIEAPYKYAQETDEKMRLGYILLRPPTP